MSTRKPTMAVLFICLATALTARGDDGPLLGVPVGPDEIAAIDFVVMPDGEGLPPGSGNAPAGERIYASRCLACHGAEGRDGISDVLVGGHGTLQSESPLKTVGSFWPYATTLFDYIRRAMPYLEPGSLSDDEVYALTAYLLFLNGIVEQEDILSAETLPNVEMPNRDNFVWAYTPK